MSCPNYVVIWTRHHKTDHQQPEKFAPFRAATNIYVKEEIQAEALTRDIEGFSRFLYVVAVKNAEFFDISKLSSQAAMQRKTAERFLEILEETLICHRIDSFAKSTYRCLIQHPGYFFFDIGVLNALLGFYQESTDRIGSLFETLFF